MKLALLMLGPLGVSIPVLVVSLVLGAWEDSHEGYAMLLIVFICGPAPLLGTWIALGGKRTLWRIVGIIVAMTVCVSLDSMGGFGLALDEWTIPVVVPMALTALALLVARAAGAALNEVGQNRSVPPAKEFVRRDQWDVGDNDAVAPRFQCSLSSLLSWTAAIAVLLSCVATCRIVGCAHAIDEFLSWDWVKECGTFALVPPAAVWAALGTRWIAARISLLGVGILGTAVVQASAPWGLNLEALQAVLIPTVSAFLWVTGVLLVVRTAGYRLVWRERVIL